MKSFLKTQVLKGRRFA